MSAYVHDDQHINAIVSAVRLYEFPPVRINEIYCDVCILSHAKLVVRILKAENIRSVNYRYHDNEPLYQGIEFEPDQKARLNLFGLHKAISSLDYQSCETEDWPGTFACGLLEAWSTEIERRTGYTADTIRDDIHYQAESTWNIQ